MGNFNCFVGNTYCIFTGGLLGVSVYLLMIIAFIESHLLISIQKFTILIQPGIFAVRLIFSHMFTMEYPYYAHEDHMYML